MKKRLNFIQLVEDGLKGKNVGLHNGLDKLNKYLYKTQKATYYAIGGMPGCHSKGTFIRMLDGSLKAVEDIKVGNLLVGPDSKPRKVLQTVSGIADLYNVIPNKGNMFTVTEDHVLNLKCSGNLSKQINITIKDYLKLAKPSRYKLWRTATEFPVKPLEFDPYILGLWLGDGTSLKPAITNVDTEVINACQAFAAKHNLVCKKTKQLYEYTFVANVNNERKVLNVTTNTVYPSVTTAAKAVYRDATNVSEAIKKGILCNGCHFKYLNFSKNFMLDWLRDNNLLGNKHIPESYMINSSANRLALLAGLLDTDGHLGKNNSFSIVQVRHNLALQIQRLAQSLGYYASINTRHIKNKPYYTVGIYGDLAAIPTRIKRKQSSNVNTRALCTGFKIKKASPGEFYGFTVDRDHLYLLEDQIVTHNSGKSAFTDDNFVLSPYLYYMNQGIKINAKWFYYSFEISEEAKRAKWTAYKLWNDFRIKIDPAILMGKDEKLKITNDEFKKIVSVDNFMSELMYDYMEFIQDPLNPTGILHDIEKYMLTVGKLETEPYIKTDGTPGTRIIRYIPNDPDHHVIVIVDHVALTKEERGFNTKQNIDKLSEYMRYLRNLYKITPVLVCQFNKGLSGVERQKLAKANHDDLAPILEDFKDTGNIGQDANVAIGLFNPAKYNIQEYAGYDIAKMPSSFRSVHLMKNRDGAEYFTAGMHFMGGIGMMRELPPADMFEAGLYDYKNYQ